MKNKKLKFIINFIIIFVVLCIVLYFSLRENYHEIISSILNMNIIFVLIAGLLLCLYRVSTSLAHWCIVRANNEHISYLKLLQINFIILFFHGVTPFAGGGQPMEVYYLHNEGIKVSKATNITLQNFIVYQIALVLMGIFALFMNIKLNLFPNDHFIKKLVVLGFIINLMVLVITFLLSFCNKFNSFVCIKVIHLLRVCHIIKDEEKVRIKVKKYLDSFHENALELKKSQSTFIKGVLLNILGLVFFYSIPYAVIRGVNVDINILYSIIATSYVMIIGSFIPIPGGTGGIEYGFVFFYSFLIKGSIVNAIMLVWRFISYYFGMMLGAVCLSFYKKGDRL